MAKQIIILERLATPTQFRYALWAVVPLARRPFYANANATSAWKDASAGEITSLKNGEVVERVETYSRPGATVATVKADLVTRFTAFQAEIDGANDWQRYGSFYENSAWTDAGV